MAKESKNSGETAKDKAPSEVYAGKGSNVDKEADEKGSAAEEMKKGGRAKRKRGGGTKEFGSMKGEHKHERADRKPRKSGGMCSSEWTAAQGKGDRRPGSTEDA